MFQTVHIFVVDMAYNIKSSYEQFLTWFPRNRRQINSTENGQAMEQKSNKKVNKNMRKSFSVWCIFV